MLRRPTALPSLLLVLLAALSFSAPRSLHGQALPIATRTADISVFGGFATGLPDYGPYRNNGGSFGVNFTRYLHLPVAPSIEARANFLNGKTVNERTYLFGVRAQGDLFTRLHPYANFLIGPGDIHFNFFNNGYVGDNSTVYSIGGGADYDIARHWQAKVDFQYQHWKTGNNVTYTPTLTVIGVAYRIPFRPHFRQGEIRH
ncbi:MAG TPA: outer membrane beta-barrel protein [Acidobacteriaceae bacterium]|nr:outer membrane beta-barrel protein [Acidobacteriaceae bacterium]